MNFAGIYLTFSLTLKISSKIEYKQLKIKNLFVV